MSNDAELTIRLLAKNEASKVLKDVESHAGGLGKVLSNVGSIAGGFLAANVIGGAAEKLTGFISNSLEQGIKLGESINAVQKIFGTSSETILAWGKTSATSFGLSQQAFNQLATPLGAILRNAGFAADEVADKTINLTKRAADMASVFNTDVDTALEAIMSGLKGEANPLEQFGVGLSAAKVEAQALSETHKKSAADLTSLELQTARYNLILKETATSEGDFTQTSGQAANAARIQQAKMEELSATIGTQLIPVQLMITKAKLAMVEAITNHVIPAVSGFIRYIKEVVSTGDTMNDFLMNLPAPLRGAAIEMGKVAIFVQTTLIPAFEQVVAFVKEHWPEISAVIQFAEEFIIARIQGIIQTIQGIVEVVSGVIALVQDLFHGRWREAWQDLQDIAAGIVDIALGMIKEQFGNIPGIIVDALGDVSSLLYNAGRDILNGFINGITSKLSDLKNTLSDVAHKATDWKGPPEKDRVLLTPAGQLVMEGFITGLQNRIPALREILSQITDMLNEGEMQAYLEGKRAFDAGLPVAQEWLDTYGSHLEELVNGVWQRASDDVRGTAIREVPNMPAASGGPVRGGRGGATIIINNYIQGSVWSDRDIVNIIRNALEGGSLRGYLDPAA